MGPRETISAVHGNGMIGQTRQDWPNGHLNHGHHPHARIRHDRRSASVADRRDASALCTRGKQLYLDGKYFTMYLMCLTPNWVRKYRGNFLDLLMLYA